LPMSPISEVAWKQLEGNLRENNKASASVIAETLALQKVDIVAGSGFELVPAYLNSCQCTNSLRFLSTTGT
ncbi:hypothetical protein ACE1CD_34030, partial [Aerosakkonema sp. BLCC-F183]|uniref:hypothetical protein n=1 Tax=Aerosakkonema sp. BLCC-F183 TaxID=3342834 RepID=UPI0035B9A585